MKWKRISKENAAFQVFTALMRSHRKRQQHDRFIVEGVIPVNLCVQSQLRIESILISEGRTLSRWAEGLLATVDCESVYQLAAPLMADLSGRDDSSEVLLVAEYPHVDVATLTLEEVQRSVILDRPSSPGNLGAIIRSCDAFGLDAVFLTGHHADPYDPKSITASRGTVFTVPVLPIESNTQLADLLTRLRRCHDRFCLYGSSGKYGSDIRALFPSPSFGLIVGNETYGMSDFLKQQTDEVVRIEMRGAASSLNVACATSILLYELLARGGA